MFRRREVSKDAGITGNPLGVIMFFAINLILTQDLLLLIFELFELSSQSLIQSITDPVNHRGHDPPHDELLRLGEHVAHAAPALRHGRDRLGVII